MSIKALVVTPIYPSPDNPQAGTFIHRQVVNLTRQGVECRVLVYRPAPPPFPRWIIRRSWLRYYYCSLRWPREIERVPVETVFYDRQWAEGEDVVPAIGDALIRFIETRPECLDTDIVYAHWLWTGGAAALHLRRKFGWPVAAIARGSEMHDWHAVHPRCRPYVEQVIREADLVLTNCQDLRDRAETLAPGSSARISVVYNGCDAERFFPVGDKSEIRKELGLDAGARLMLFCGGIIKRKGITEMAAAWKRFSAQHPDWQLILVGQKVEKDLVKELEQSGNGKVLFAGQVPPALVVKYMQAADAYLQPSRLEGLANATMEAMAAALPVISTDTCGQRELIEDGENGLLIEPGDSDALYRAMETLNGDDERAAQMGQRARCTILERFDPHREAARLAALLRETAESAKARAR